MKLKATVTGPFPVNGKTKGKRVVLDTEETNVKALVAAGLIRLDKNPEVS